MSALPPRYAAWGEDFWTRVDAVLDGGDVRPAARAVLDVGAGRHPTIAAERRPAGAEYVGLDVSASELAIAPPGSYDETVAADAHDLQPALVGRFDLIVAWQVLEHFRDLRQVAEVLEQYATDGGVFVAKFSGRNAAYAIGNRVLPNGAGSRLVAKLMRRPIDTVFPAYYDRCDAKHLPEAFAAWDELEIVPVFCGATYFDRLPPLRSLYLRYENWAASTGRGNLATHYVIAARKRPRST